MEHRRLQSLCCKRHRPIAELLWRPRSAGTRQAAQWQRRRNNRRIPVADRYRGRPAVFLLARAGEEYLHDRQYSLQVGTATATGSASGAAAIVHSRNLADSEEGSKIVTDPTARLTGFRVTTKEPKSSWRDLTPRTKRNNDSNSIHGTANHLIEALILIFPLTSCILWRPQEAIHGSA